MLGPSHGATAAASAALCVVVVGVGAGSTSAAAPRSASTAQAIVFVRASDLYAVTLGGRVARLTRTRGPEAGPAVSPDGRRIAFARLGGLSVMRLDSRRTEFWARQGHAPAWAPDGRTIYFVSNRPAAHGASCGVISSMTSRVLRRVTAALPGHHVDPAVSPDGRAIAFTHWDLCEGGTASPKLTVVDRRGRPTHDLARLPGNGYYPNPERASPAWSPDGTRLAFRKGRGLFVSSRDGTGERRVATRLDYVDAPAWSRDGRWIAFTDSGSVYVVRPDGSGLRRLARGTDVGGWLPSLP